MKKLFLLVLLACFGLFSKGQGLVFSGRVTGAQSGGIPGATVYVLNTNLSVLTDNDGRFSIKNAQPGTYAIQVSAVGYASVNKTFRFNGNDSGVNIILTRRNVQLDEVIVTAQKNEEDLQKVPISVSALSSRQVEEYRLWNIKDVTAIVPNLYSSSPGDYRNVTSIRGITTTSYDPAVATYVDGVNQFGLDTYIGQLLDVERIEVLRGPQGTLYGRNAMGGVINIITRQPGNDTRVSAAVDFGNYGLQRYNLAARMPLIKDRLFFGVAGLYSKLDGYYTNLFNNTRFDRQHSFIGNYYLKYLATSRLSFTLNVKHNENRNYGAFQLASTAEDALSDPFKVNQDAVTKMVDNVFNSSLSIHYAGKGFNFSSQTSYQSNLRYYTQPIDADFSPIDGVALVTDYGHPWNKVKAGTQEFRFTSPASSASPLKWTAGTYAFSQTNPSKQGLHFGKDAALVGAPFPDFTNININRGKSYGVAIYGQVTYTVLPQLDLSVGMRYDYEHKKQNVEGEFQMDGQSAEVTREDTSSSARFHALSPKVSVAFRLSDNNNIYATYSRGFRAGGITQLSSDPSQPPLFPYKPEYSNNFEIGTKNTFLENRLRVNASLFYTSVTDAQVPTLILPDAITVTKNAGKLQSKGAEVELVSALVKGLEVDYSLGYTHATYSDLNVSSNGAVAKLTGNRQVFTPDVTSMLALQYQFNLSESSGARLIARGEWKYTGNQYFDLANKIGQTAYNILNAKAGVSLKKFDFFLWAANISNTRYIDYAYDFGPAHLGNPKTYGVSFMARF